MLRRLLKVANKIDKLGLTKEADLLDNIIKKMAAMGEGSPAWLEMDNPGAAGEDSELEMNDEGELNYPEQKTVKTRSSNPKTMSFPTTAARQKFIAAAKEVFEIIKTSIDQVQKSMMQADSSVFDLEDRIRPIVRDLINNYSNDQDSKNDVKETIGSLLTLIREEKEKALPYLTEWAFFNEDWHGMASELEYDFETLDQYPERALTALPGIVRGLGDLMDFFDSGVREIEAARDFTDELKAEDAYTKMDEIVEIIEPAATLIEEVYDIASSAKAAADKKFEEYKSLIPEDLADLGTKMPSNYILPPDLTGWDRVKDTSPEQAQFEESMFGLGEDVDNIRGDWHDEEDADNWED